jgi:hypothetical protein
VTADRDSADVHQHYVNAERADDEIPDYFNDRLSDDINNELLQSAVFRELWYSDDVIHSKGSLQSDFDMGWQTVQSRLNEMVEAGVLKKSSMGRADYWWINFPQSEYPLPKDVVLYPESEEDSTSVSEFFHQLPVQIGVGGLLLTVVGGIVVWVGTLSASGIATLPFNSDVIIALALTLIFFSYIFFLLAVTAWFVQKSFLNEGETLPGFLSE